MKNTITAIIVLAFLIVLAILIKVHRNNAVGYRPVKVFAGVDSTNISAIQIRRDRENIDIVKKDTTWYVVANGNTFLANQPSCRRAEQSIETATATIISTNKQRLPEFGLADSGKLSIIVKTRNGKETRPVYFGKPGHSYKTVYIKFPNNSKAYLCSGISLYDFNKNLTDWREKQVYKLQRKDIDSASVIVKSDTISIARQGDSFLVTKGKIGDPNGLGSYIVAAYAMAFADTLSDSACGLVTPFVSITIYTNKGHTVRIHAGKSTERGVFLTCLDRPSEKFVVYKAWLDNILRKTGHKVLKKKMGKRRSLR